MVRVSPTVPLEMLLPVICDKCEFGVQTTVLLRESRSDELLDTTRTLNELGLRELFAKDTGSGWPADLERQTTTPEAGECVCVDCVFEQMWLNVLSDRS